MFIEVTQRDIDSGTRQSLDKCPIALALRNREYRIGNRVVPIVNQSRFVMNKKAFTWSDNRADRFIILFDSYQFARPTTLYYRQG